MVQVTVQEIKTGARMCQWILEAGMRFAGKWGFPMCFLGSPKSSLIQFRTEGRPPTLRELPFLFLTK